MSVTHTPDTKKPQSPVQDPSQEVQQGPEAAPQGPSLDIAPPPKRVMAMQRLIGNQAVMRLYKSRAGSSDTFEGEEIEADEDFKTASDMALSAAGDPPVQRTPSFLHHMPHTIQRDGADPFSGEKVQIIQPITGSRAQVLSAMMNATQKLAEKAGNAKAADGVGYIVVADAVYVYDSKGSQLDRLPFQFAEAAEIPPPGYYLDSGGSGGDQVAGWKTLISLGKQGIGFRTLAFDNADHMQMSQWLSPESLQKLTTYRGSVHSMFMAITPGDGSMKVDGDGAAKKAPPKWAQDQAKRAQDKIAKLKEAGGGKGGSGGGQDKGEGKGKGDGVGDGTGLKGGGQDKGDGKGSGPGKEGGKDGGKGTDPKGSGDKTTGQDGDKTGDAPKTYDTTPDRVVMWSREDGKCFLNVWVGASYKTMEMLEGETDEELLRRIQDSAVKLRMDADVDMSKQLLKGAAKTQIDPTASGGDVTQMGAVPNQSLTPVGGGSANTDPSLRGLGNDIQANTPAYPAKIINYGADVTVSGASNRFSMEIDYGSAGSDMLSQVAARMQSIRYYWELIDVTHLTAEHKKEKLEKTNVGGGEKAESGQYHDLSRAFSNIGEDTMADLNELGENPEMLPLDWPARAAWLGVIGLSDVVQAGGALISSYISLVSSPLNERSIGFTYEGEFIIRCVATPMPSDDARAKPESHLIRASSVAVTPVKVMNINKRAQAAMDEVPKDIQELKKQIEDLKDSQDPKDITERERLTKQLHSRETENTPQSVERQLNDVFERIRILGEMRDGLKAGDLKKRSPAARMLNVQLELMNMSADQYEKDLKRTEEQLLKLRESAQIMGKHISGDSVKVQTIFASEDNGQVMQMLTMLGPSADKTKDKVAYTFADITSPNTRGYYTGTSSNDTEDGHRQAILNAFEEFRANNDYGRGALMIKATVPVVVGGKTVTLQFDEKMRSSPGKDARAIQRLKDLATAAELAGLVLSGPAGMLVGALGGLAGAVVAGHGMMKRARGETLHWDFQTIMDVTALVGGAMSIAQPLALAARGIKTWAKTAERVGNALHFAGIGMMAGQTLVIPVSLMMEFEAIDKEAREQNLPPGEVAARRAEALLSAVRSSLITVIAARGGIEFGDGTGAKKPKSGETPEPHGTNKTPVSEVSPRNLPGGEPHGTVPDVGNVAPELGKVREGDGPGGAPKSAGGPKPKMEPTLLAPKKITDVTFNTLHNEAAQALGEGGVPQRGRIRIVDDSLANILYERVRGKNMPEETIGFHDPDANILYMPRSKATAEVRQRLVKMIQKRVSVFARNIFGESFVNAYAEFAAETIIYDGKSMPASSVSPADLMLISELQAHVGGGGNLDSAIFGGDIKGLRTGLVEKYGQARANAIEAAIKAGKSSEAMGLMSEPKVTLRNEFGEILSAGVEDLIASEMGGQARNPDRLALTNELAQVVGADVLKNALQRGDTKTLRENLTKALGPKAAQELIDALAQGRVKDARKVLKDAASAEATAAKAKKTSQDGSSAGTLEHLPADESTSTQEPSAPTKPTEHAKVEKGQAPVGEKAGQLRAMIDGIAASGGTTAVGGGGTELAASVIKEVKSFSTIRRMVEEGAFGASAEHKNMAREVLQQTRNDIINEVLNGIKAKIEAKYPGVELTLKDLGTPGFGSDRDVTLKAEAKAESAATTSDKVRASLDAVEMAYAELNQRGLPPDKALDSNYYTELHEGSIQPKDAQEARSIRQDQSVVSLTEVRMGMSKEQWLAYKEEQLKKLGKGTDADGLQGTLDRENQAKAKQMFEKAEQMFAELGYGNPHTKEGQLTKLREELKAKLSQDPPASAREIRDLMARIKLLEPDAYGARAAVEAVVDTQQGLARPGDNLKPGETVRGKVNEIQDARTNARKPLTKAERLAQWAQESAASLGKIYGHAHKPGSNTAKDAAAIAKYLGRIYSAFREAGFSIKHSLIERGVDVVGAKGEADSSAGIMRELRAWAQDTNRINLTDPQLIELFISEAQKLGLELDTRIRAEQMRMEAMGDYDFGWDNSPSEPVNHVKNPPAKVPAQ